MKRFSAALLLLASLACDSREPMAPTESGEGPESGLSTATGEAGGSDVASGVRTRSDFVVVLGEGEDPASVARDHGVQPRFLFREVLHGFSGTISDAARAGLLKDGRVRRIAPDQVFSIDAESSEARSWGLDRVDQRTGSLDQTYTYLATGSGVTAYVVDTGIRYSHDDFGGRATPGFDAFGGDGSDCHSHGTHVAGTVGGTVYGVAKQVSLVAVRVLNCTGSGTTSTVLAGLDWVAANGVRPGVVNMSLGGGADDLVDAAVSRVIAAGFPVVVAAGNAGADACRYSPGRVSAAITIGATSSSDARTSWSNWGLCVDWFAPGASITSAGIGGDDATAVKSGTSMAAPHAAGAAALYLDDHTQASPGQVADALAAMTTKGVVAGSFSPYSDLLYTLNDGSNPSWDNAVPVADFAFECTDLTCQFTDRSTDSDGTVVGWQWSFGDGTGELKQNPAHTYPAAGTYSVTLIAKDDDGATSPTTYEVSLGSSDPVPDNSPPLAAFTFSCDGLSCGFTDGSSDADGTVVGWQWTFGDGGGATTRDPAHTYAAPGTYEVALTARDDDGATSSTTRYVTVEGSEPPPPENTAPDAAFHVQCDGLACTFQDQSSDTDGTLSRWEWDFGDGSSAVVGSSAEVRHEFAAGGSYQVRLTVFDDDGASDSAGRDLTVEDPGLTLTAVAAKDKGRHVLDLTWRGATTTDVDVYLSGFPVITTVNDGSYSVVTENRGKGSYLVWVCEAGTDVCSSERRVEY